VYRLVRLAYRLLVSFAIVALVEAGSVASPAGREFAGRAAMKPNSVPSLRATRGGRAAGPNGFSGMRVNFEHSLIGDNGILIANYAKQYGISTIYVPVAGDDISSLANANPTTVNNLHAMIAVANVYLVAGDYTWLATPTVVPPDVASLARIVRTYPMIAGVVYAFDPEQAPGWYSSQQGKLISEYFTLIGTIQNSSYAAAFASTLFLADTNFATLPSSSTPGAPTMLQALQTAPRYGGALLMVHGGSESAQLNNLSGVLSQLTKPFTIEASTSPYGGSTYHGVSQSYLSTNLTQLAQAVAAQNASFAGIEVSGWSDLYNSLQSVLPEPPVFNGKLATGPLVPPAGKTYLGAYVNPNGGDGQSIKGTAAFESQIGRTLAYDMHFYGWQSPFPGAEEADDVKHGRIPLEAWNCGDSDAHVAAGDDDANIIKRAKAIRAFGKPIMIRWFWEMNLDDTNNAPRTQCYDRSSDLPGGYFAPGPYIKAWAHIRAVFASQGVTNVVWLWCVANAHGGPAQYYPGDSEVDWVGMDDYDTNDVSLNDTFYILAEELSQFQEKPFMITETGAHASNQVSFLTGAANVLQTNYPWARAVGYLDATGNFQAWSLSPAGLGAFKTFAQTPYMSAMESSAPIR
jgi:hypothetical protein